MLDLSFRSYINYAYGGVELPDRPTPSYIDEVEPVDLEEKAFDDFCNKYDIAISFLIEARQETRERIKDTKFTEREWDKLIIKVRKLEEELNYHAETYEFDGWDVDLTIIWHKFYYSVEVR